MWSVRTATRRASRVHIIGLVGSDLGGARLPRMPNSHGLVDLRLQVFFFLKFRCLGFKVWGFIGFSAIE